MNFSQYIDFLDFCEKTGTDPETAFQKILENIDILAEQIEKIKEKDRNDNKYRVDSSS